MDREISLYDALEDIYIDEPDYFGGEEIINNYYGSTKPVLETPGTSPPRDYETGDPFCDTVNLDEFFASVFNRDEEGDGGAVLKGQGQSAAVGSGVISSTRGQAEENKVNVLGSGSSVKSSSVVRQNEIFQDQPARTLSFGEEIDEYIRVHLMPYCSHDHHQDPPAQSNEIQTAAVAPQDVPGLDKITFHAESLPQDCEDSDATSDARLDATGEAQTSAEVKKEMQLKLMTPIVVLTRFQTILDSPTSESIPPEAILPKPAAPVSPFCSNLTKRTAVSTGGKVIKGRKRGRATAIIKKTLNMTTSSSTTSTPVTTIPGSRKRGRPPKVNIKTGATHGSCQDVITIDDESEKKPPVIAPLLVTSSSRPRRASIGAVYYGDPDSDEFTDEGPRSAKIKRPMSAPRNKQNKKPDITETT